MMDRIGPGIHKVREFNHGKGSKKTEENVGDKLIKLWIPVYKIMRDFSLDLRSD